METFLNSNNSGGSVCTQTEFLMFLIARHNSGHYKISVVRSVIKKMYTDYFYNF